VRERPPSVTLIPDSVELEVGVFSLKCDSSCYRAVVAMDGKPLTRVTRVVVECQVDQSPKVFVEFLS
jgi:hypothetical protein